MSNMSGYDSLESLNDSKYEWRIKVRVIRVWDSYSTKVEKEFKGRNLLFMDDKHNRMHAFIWPNYMDLFEKKLEEGKIYSIRNFSVKSYRKDSLRCTRYDKQIWLSNYTKIVPIEENQKLDKMIREVEFDFFDIGDIKDLAKQSDNNYLIDVIGVVKDKDFLRHFVNQREVEQRSFRFTLTDGSASIKVCFWDDLAESFATELEKFTESPVVVIVSSCKQNEYKGEPYVSNVGATRYYINYNHRSVDQLKKRATAVDFNILQPGQKEVPRTLIMTIAQLRTLEATSIMTRVMCQVTVRTVTEAKDWNYDACSSCQKEIEIINGKFRCDDCKRNIPFPEKRFRLCFIAEDATGGAAFVLFDREVESMIGKTVFDVIAEQERQGKIADFPSILKTFEGQQYTLTICLTDENVTKGSHTYFVVDIYKGLEVIEDNNLDDDDFSSGFKNKHHSYTSSVSKHGFKTPDTEKSTSGNRLKRVNDEVVISITNLDDIADVPDKKTEDACNLPLKHIKKEKV